MIVSNATDLSKRFSYINPLLINWEIKRIKIRTNVVQLFEIDKFVANIKLIASQKALLPFRPTNNFQQRVAYNVDELPRNYSNAALLTCLCCCWPLGLMSLIKSNEVETAISQGDISRAQRASVDAKNYAIAALACGVTIFIISIIVFFMKITEVF